MFCFCSGMALFENLGKVMAPTDTLKLTCADCGRRAEWPRAQAFRLFGPDAAPYEVRRRARCGGCGSRRVDVAI